MGALPSSLRLVPARNRPYVWNMAWEPVVTHVHWDPLEMAESLGSSGGFDPYITLSCQILLGLDSHCLASQRKAGRWARLPAKSDILMGLCCWLQKSCLDGPYICLSGIA